MSHSKESPKRKAARQPRDLYPLFDELPVGVLVLDAAGIVLHMNPTAAEWLGRPEAGPAARDLFRDLLPALESEGLGEKYRSEAGGEAMEIDVDREVQTAGGARALHLSLRRLRIRSFIGGLALLQDRTALFEEERRRRRAESMASVGELAAGLAHEVNNPLAAIKSLGQLLAREATRDEQRHALELIIEESDRIGRAIGTLVSFARQQGASGREPVDLSTLVEGVIDVRRYSLDAAGIETRIDLDRSLPPVMGEPGALQQVVLNLVMRAERALESRQTDRMLIVRSRESSEGVVLYVVDNGPGIPRDALPHLFNPSTAALHGEGLDLATSARIIRDHGGYMLAESEPERGAVFFVRLPRAGDPPLSAPPEAAIPAASEPRRKLRVLLADDEATLRLAISLFLTRRGHLVTQAADAYEALRLAEEQEFDVALIDARMPGDGVALQEQLEQMPSLSGRTALMTGDLSPHRSSQRTPTGPPVLLKPFDLNEAVTLIEDLAERTPT